MTGCLCPPPSPCLLLALVVPPCPRPPCRRKAPRQGALVPPLGSGLPLARDSTVDLNENGEVLTQRVIAAVTESGAKVNSSAGRHRLDDINSTPLSFAPKLILPVPVTLER